MKKLLIPFLTFSALAFLLSACSSMSTMKNKLADMQYQKKKLSDGSEVLLGINLAPTSAWKCKEIGTPQYYSWSTLQFQGQFNFRGPVGMLADKAVAAANQDNIKPNYINLYIPEEKLFTTGSSKATVSQNYNRDDNAVATYYQCQLINPERKIGSIKTKEVGVLVD